MQIPTKGTRFGKTESWRHASHPLLRLRPILGRDWAAAYVFMLPSILILGGLIAYPFLRALYVSFTRTHGATIGPLVGLANYQVLWEDKYFRDAVWVTVRYTSSSIALTLLLSLPAAGLLHRLERGGGLLTGLFLLPWVMPEIVRAITWKGLLDPLYGGLNRLLLNLGVIRRAYPFFGSPGTALASVVLVNVWQRVPLFTLNLLAGLKAIDAELYEAAAIDGAGSWRRFLHITLPGLRFALIVAVLLGTIWSFNEFSLIFLLTGGGPMNATKVYSVLAYQYARQRGGMAAAVVMTMAPIFVVLIAVLGRYVMVPASDERSLGGWASRWRGLYRSATGPMRWVGRVLRIALWAVHDTVEGAVVAISSHWHRYERAGPVMRKWRRRLASLSPYLGLLPLLAFELLPFYWVVVTSFKSELQITRFESVLWPRPWTLAQFEKLLGPQRSFVLWLQNSLLLALVTPLISVGAAAVGAYAIARLQWRGAKLLGIGAFISYLMPMVMLVVPIYQLFVRLGLGNTRLGLILSYPSLTVPFALWLMTGYYASIPRELDDAAMIDGCDRWQGFVRVILPLSKPALIAAALFGFSQAWSEFLLAYTLVISESKMTIPMGLALMIFGDVLPWGELSAAALLVAVPVLIVYVAGQRFMVAGLVQGAIRGRA